jgi:hypothetical protein
MTLLQLMFYRTADCFFLKKKTQDATKMIQYLPGQRAATLTSNIRSEAICLIHQKIFGEKA